MSYLAEAWVLGVSSPNLSKQAGTEPRAFWPGNMDPEDALKSQGRPETVDLTQAPTSPKPKKLKQMRLPFTRIHTNHASVADHPVAEGVTQPSGTECEKKRKHSSDGEPTPSKKEKLDGANAVEMMDIAHDDKTSPSLKKTPQRIAPTPIGSDAVKCKSPTVKKRITPTPVQNQAQDQVNSPKVRKTPKEAKTKKLTPKETKTKQIPKRIQPTLLTNLKIKSPTTSTSNDWTAATSTEKELKGPVSPSPTTGKNASDTPDGSTPKSCPQEVPCSPSVIEEYKRKIQVAIAKLSVETNELNEAMDQAAADKEFIKAANIKIQVDQITVKKDGWQSAFDEAKDDGGKLGQLLKTIKSPDDANGQLKVTAEPAKDFQTPKRKKAIQVKPPGSGGPSPGSAKKLTPKQEAKKLEIQKKKEEKEQERLEKERLKEEERVKKEEQRLEKERAKEEERLKKEEQRLEKIKAKKEKEEMKERLKREKEEEKKQKELERQQKEDAKQAEILEKQRKEEEKKKHEESEKIRLQKAAQSFSSFFIKKTSLDSPEEKETPKSVVPEHLNLFRVKKDMRLAPNDDKSEEDEAAQLAKSKIKAKLLQFDDNLRPAYWGTWSKTSNVVGPRRPFAQDSGLLDYEYDSGDDWEEEEPGESLSDAENDKEDDDDDDGEIADEDEDDGFFVGHGVLDKDEIHNEDDDDEESEDKSDQASAEEGASTSGKCGLSFDEEWEMKKQKLREQEFEREYFSKKKPVKLKPRVFGCMWMDDNQNSLVYEQLMKILQPFKVVSLCPCPIPTMCSSPKPSPSETNTPNSVRNASDTPLTTGKVKRMFPDEAYPDLVRLVHANTNGKFFLAKEFSEFWTRRSNRSTGKAPEKVPASTSTPGTPSVNSGEISKRKILETITEIADYKKLPNPGPMQNRMCWVVKEDVLSKFELESLPIPNDWSYILEQPNKFEGPKSAAKSSSNSASLSTPSKPGNDMAKKSIQSKFFTLVPKKKPTTQPADTVASKPEAEAPMEVVEAIVEENKDAPKSQSNV
ncbi:hypothetical protein TCAL_16436 [Tigriopus californicus]|uniref:Uncharacterized protein n=1 Tax=Tigriopus californicus TaxID=6832 RepID=A0A553P0B6_TIGCA|nr:hypothetical protein TCAL_16436 [Tigriopus californicus]